MIKQHSTTTKTFYTALSLAPLALLGSASISISTANPSRADSQSYNTTTYENLNYANPTKWERPSQVN